MIPWWLWLIWWGEIVVGFLMFLYGAQQLRGEDE